MIERRPPLRVAAALLAALIGCSPPGSAGDASAQEGGGAGRAEQIPGVAMHSPVPGDSLPDLRGVWQPLRARASEVTLINLWATWCVPCLKEIPELVHLGHAMAPHGVRIVGIALDSGDPRDIAAFAERHAMDYAVLYAEYDWARRRFAVFGLPVTLIADRDGVIRRKLVGPQTEAAFAAALRPYL